MKMNTDISHQSHLIVTKHKIKKKAIVLVVSCKNTETSRNTQPVEPTMQGPLVLRRSVLGPLCKRCVCLIWCYCRLLTVGVEWVSLTIFLSIVKK